MEAKHKLYFILISKPWTITIIGLAYLIVLKLTNVSYCSWIGDTAVYWDFPLEKDVANQSWEEAPSNGVTAERWSILEKRQDDAEQIKQINFETIKRKAIMEQNAKVGTSELEPKYSREDVMFLKSLRNLSTVDQAIAINDRLYRKIYSTISTLRDNEINIVDLISKVMSQDCSYTYWVAKTELDVYSEDHIASIMTNINLSFASTNKDLNEDQKLILIHINTQLQIFSLTNVTNEDPNLLLQNRSVYNSIFQKNLDGLFE